MSKKARSNAPASTTLPGKKKPVARLVARARDDSRQLRIDFNREYVPIDSIQRRARLGLLRQWDLTRDAFVASHLRWQEDVEVPHREAVVAIYGKGAGWREAAIVQAKHDAEIREELGAWLGAVAASGNQDEFSAFAAAMKRVCLCDETGPTNRKRLMAILFVLRCWTKRNGLPTQAGVRDFLKQKGFETEGDTRKNEARDFFTGPILGTLPKAKAGRRKLASSALKR